MPFRKSLVFRIFVISFILLAVPLLVDSFVIVQGRYNDNVKNAKEYLIKSPESRVFVLSRVLQVRRQAMAFGEYFLHLKEDFPHAMSQEFNDKLKQLALAGSFEDALLIKIGPGQEMDVIGSSFPNEESKQGFHSFQFYERLAQQNYTKGSFSILFDYPQERHHLLFAQVIYGADKKTPQGILMVLMDVTNRLTDMLATIHGTFPMHYALLLNTMVVIAAEDPALQFQYFFPLSPKKLEEIKESHPFSGDRLGNEPISVTHDLGPPFISFTWGGVKQIGVITPIQDTDFHLLSFTPENELFVNPFINFLTIYSIFGLILLVGGELAYLACRRISRPFKKISEVMEGIQKGDLTKRYTPDPLGFEINTLGLSFNEMVDTLLEKKFLAEEERVRVEIYEKELKIGQVVQRGLLPSKMPTLEGIEIAERYLPAKEVGGDFYDVFLRTFEGNEQMALVVADASGKGIQACFYSLGARSDLRVFAREYKHAGEIMGHVNRLFYDDSGDTGMFVTLLLGIYDPKTKVLEYSSSGHNPPYVRKRDGRVEMLGGIDMALGVKKDVVPQTKRAQLEQGDLLVFYTDGVTEAHNEKNELFTEERLVHFIEEKGGLSAEQVAGELIKELKEFQGNAPQHDDITLLLMKLL